MTSHSGPDADSLRPSDPRQVGPYRVLGRLGRGGMGTVFLAETASGERAAVKVINAELADDPSFRDRFRREVDAARRVRRFCTAPVVDANLDQDPLYSVTEYIDGPDLEHAVTIRGPLPGSDLEGLAVGVATALVAIHGAGVVHRDLKPSNVLLSTTGPRVIDFGIARALDTLSGTTRTGQIVGTPGYLAPELLRGEEITPASDIFSWGCVVSYAGTGRSPFSGRTAPEIMYKVVHDAPALEGLDAGLRTLVGRALDKDPRNRPTAQDLLAALVGHEHADPAQAAETIKATWPRLAETRVDAAGLGPTRAAEPARPAGQDQPVRSRFQPTRRMKIAAGAGGGVLVAAVGAIAAVIALVPGVTGPEVPKPIQTIVQPDNFADPGSGWNNGLNNDRYHDGVYTLALKGGIGASDIDAQARVPSDKTWPARARIDVKVKIDSASSDTEAGLKIRDIALSGEYQFWLRNNGTARIKKDKFFSGIRELIAHKANFHRGEFNRLQVVCSPQNGGTRLQLWVNGGLVLDYTDTFEPLKPTIPSLIIDQDIKDPGSSGTFDDFAVYGV
jgi:hypothetical protein